MQEQLEQYSRKVESENGLTANSINITPEMLKEYVDDFTEPMNHEAIRLYKKAKAKAKVKRNKARKSRRINRGK